MVEATGDATSTSSRPPRHLAAKGMQQPGMAGMFSSFRARTRSFTWTSIAKGQDDGRAAHRRIRRAPGGTGQLLRQRLQTASAARGKVNVQADASFRPTPTRSGRSRCAIARRHGAAGRDCQVRGFAGPDRSSTTCFRRPINGASLAVRARRCHFNYGSSPPRAAPKHGQRVVHLMFLQGSRARLRNP